MAEGQDGAAPAAAVTPPKQNRRAPSLNDTTAVSMTTAGAGGIVLWIFQCIAAGQIMVPSTETCFSIAGFSLPVVQAWRDYLKARIERAAEKE